MKTRSSTGEPDRSPSAARVAKRVQDKVPTGALRRKQSAIGSFFTFAEVAEFLLVSDRTVHRWVERKTLVAHQFGGVTRIGATELSGFITRARRRSAPLQPRNPLADTFYTVEDVAEILNVCVRTVRRRVKSGFLVAHDFDGIIRVAGADLRDFIDRSRRD
jgi:excisionase family DNA binding protein